jgi:hypothetical protein
MAYAENNFDQMKTASKLILIPLDKYNRMMVSGGNEKGSSFSTDIRMEDVSKNIESKLHLPKTSDTSKSPIPKAEHTIPEQPQLPEKKQRLVRPPGIPKSSRPIKKSHKVIKWIKLP